jgi:hypothetical protein
MKKNKILKEEIGRIGELIETISKLEKINVLTEAPASPIVDLLSNAVREIDNLRRGGVRFNTYAEDMIDAFRRASTEDEKLQWVSMLMDESEDFYRVISPSIARFNKDLIDTLENLVDNALKTGSDPNVIKQAAQAEIDKIFQKIPSDKFKKELSDTFNERIDNYGKNFSHVSLPSGLNMKITKWMTNLPNLQTILRMGRAYFMKKEDIFRKFMEAHDIAAKLMQEGKLDQAGPYFKKMADMVAATRNLDLTPKQIWEGLGSIGQKGWKDGILPDIRQHLKYSKKGQPWHGIMEAIANNDASVKSAMNSYLELFFKWGKDVTFVDKFKQLARIAVWRDPRSMKEISEYVTKKGFKQFFAWRIAGYFVIWPTIIAGFRSLLELGKEGAEAIDGLGGERPEYGDWGDTQDYRLDFLEIWLDELLNQSVIGFIDQSFVDEIISTLHRYVLPGFKEKDVDRLEQHVKEDYEKFKDDLPPEDRENLEQAESDLRLDKTETPTETPITNPIEKEIRDGFPCAKKYPLKVISNTKVEFTNVSSGNEIILAEKINGVWTWTNTGLPLKCNK